MAIDIHNLTADQQDLLEELISVLANGGHLGEAADEVISSNEDAGVETEMDDQDLAGLLVAIVNHHINR